MDFNNDFADVRLIKRKLLYYKNIIHIQLTAEVHLVHPLS